MRGRVYGTPAQACLFHGKIFTGVPFPQYLLWQANTHVPKVAKDRDGNWPIGLYPISPDSEGWFRFFRSRITAKYRFILTCDIDNVTPVDPPTEYYLRGLNWATIYTHDSGGEALPTIGRIVSHQHVVETSRANSFNVETTSGVLWTSPKPNNIRDRCPEQVTEEIFLNNGTDFGIQLPSGTTTNPPIDRYIWTMLMWRVS